MSVSKTRIIHQLLVIGAATFAAPAFAAESGHAHHVHSVDSGTEENAQSAPALSIIMPKSGGQVSNPAAIVIETDGDIERLTMSAATIGVHLHVAVDGRSVMPVREQLIAVGGGRYVFVLDDRLPPGAHEISVYWADNAHMTIKESIRSVKITAK